MLHPATTAQTIAHGYYTVVDGKEHRTFKIHTQPQDSTFAPGKTVISFLSGSDNEHDYTGFGFIIDGQFIPWKRFRQEPSWRYLIQSANVLLHGDMTEAGRMYAMQSGQCYRCGKLLTTPESIAAGLGPTCRSK